MLRDNLAGLIEPMRAARELNPHALFTEQKQSSDDRPPCLENPRPEGAESTLTENAASPFHAELRHSQICNGIVGYVGEGACVYLLVVVDALNRETILVYA